MNPQDSIKALKSQPDPTGWTKRYYDFRFWWDFKVWNRYAPDWACFYWNRLKDFWYKQVSTRIWPRQRWLTKQISRQWSDKTHLIPELLYACVVHFCSEDGEDCFNTVYFSDEDEAMLREIWAWAVTGRKAAEEAVSAAYPPMRPGIQDWCNHKTTNAERKAYDKVNRLEAEIEEKDTKYLTWIVANRGRLWT